MHLAEHHAETLTYFQKETKTFPEGELGEGGMILMMVGPSLFWALGHKKM